MASPPVKNENEDPRDLCCLCLEIVDRSAQALARLPCGHEMHLHCSYLLAEKQSFLCPLCRKVFGADASPVLEVLAGAVKKFVERQQREQERQQAVAEHRSCHEETMRFLREHPHLPLDDGNAIHLRVKTLTGVNLNYTIHRDDYVGNLMLLIAEGSQGVPLYQQTLIFAGRSLKPTSKLSDYCIPNLATIHFVLNLRGGKPVICLSYPPGERVTVALNIPDDARYVAAWPRSFEMKSSNLWWQDFDPSSAPYLFYEFDLPDQHLKIDRKKAFGCYCDYRELSEVLENVAASQGLDAKNAADFITYCLPLMWTDLSHQDKVCFAFQVLDGPQYEAVSLMTVSPPPTHRRRFVLLWKRHAIQGLDYAVGGTGRSISPKPWKVEGERCLLEWGSMRVF
jgi:hypothetical protein